MKMCESNSIRIKNRRFTFGSTRDLSTARACFTSTKIWSTKRTKTKSVSSMIAILPYRFKWRKLMSQGSLSSRKNSNLSRPKRWTRKVKMGPMPHKLALVLVQIKIWIRQLCSRGTVKTSIWMVVKRWAILPMTQTIQTTSTMCPWKTKRWKMKMSREKFRGRDPKSKCRLSRKVNSISFC